MHKVAAIIITYNATAWLQKCLDSIFASAYPLTVYCCDNGSTDNTLSILQAAGNKIQITAAGKNLGFGAANNYCIKKAYDDGADFFLLINQDVYIMKETVDVLINTLQRNKDAGISSSMHLNGDRTSFDKNFLNSFTADRNKDFVNDLYFRQMKEVYNVSYINAACWMLPRTTIEKVGGFDPLFFHYGEDDNYCQRVLFHGLSIAVTTTTSVCHDRDDRDGSIRPEYAKDQAYRTWLLKVSNVFNKDETLLQKQLRNTYLRSIAKHIAGLQIKSVISSYKEYTAKKKTLQTAAAHKLINSKTGMHWLNELVIA